MFNHQFVKAFSIVTLLFLSRAFAVDKVAPSAEQFEVTKKTKISQIRELPDDKLVRMSNGKTIRAGNLKAFADLIKNARAKGTFVKPAEKFVNPQGIAQIQVAKGTNLHTLKTRGNSEVIQLPSGRKMTVGDFKKMDQIAIAMTGKSITDRQAPPPKSSGPAIKIKSAKDLEALASKPDSTLLESPFGKKITLGELRAYAKKNNKPVGVR